MFCFKKFAFFFLLAIPSIVFADPQKTMMNTFYLQGTVGPAVLAEIEDHAAPSNNQTPKSQSSFAGAIGYRWKYFGIEAVAASFGALSVNHDDYYTETHDTSFIGGGVHWAWWFFDLKLGFGSMNDKTKYEKGTKASTFTATPNDKSSGQTASYFGFGINVDLDHNLEFIIDYTAYAYTKDKKQTFALDGGNKSISGAEYGIGALTFGLRWFL